MERRIRLLWYNTFLLPGVDVSPLMVGLVLERLANTRRASRWLVGSLEKVLAPMSALFERPTLRIGPKPLHTQRTGELGELLAKMMTRADVDGSVAALGEVFGLETRASLSEALSSLDVEQTHGPPAGPAGVNGVVPSWLHRFMKDERLPLSGGLMTITRHLTIRRSLGEAFTIAPSTGEAASLTYPHRGHPVRDPDFWSNKGVLLTELGLEGANGSTGAIELYTTHLFSGQVIGEALLVGLQRISLKRPRVQMLVEGSMTLLRLTGLARYLEDYRHFFELPEARRLEIQGAQLHQLVDFIKAHHRRENVIILAGDFNLDANLPAERALLARELSRLETMGIEFDEPWMKDNRGGPGTVLHLDQLYGLRQGAPDDRVHPTEHIDYIFVQRRHREHGLELIIEQCHRRAFPRDVGKEGMNHLSDHMGLELILRARPVQ